MTATLAQADALRQRHEAIRLRVTALTGRENTMGGLMFNAETMESLCSIAEFNRQLDLFPASARGKEK